MQYGHFDDEKREYVIDRVDLPTSWTNYLGVEDTCVVVNHTAGGYMFYKTPEYHRITRFRGNAVPMDRPGHYVYLRDAASGDNLELWDVRVKNEGMSIAINYNISRHKKTGPVALPAPLTATTIFFACMMVLIPMV